MPSLPIQSVVRCLLLTAVSAASLLTAAPAVAHCQVPCGIFGDHMKFQELRQHAHTISKSMDMITQLAGKDDAQSAQQLTRWVVNKEAHAKKIQLEAQEYFLAQRIKLPKDDSEEPKYVAQLKALHEIIIYAMRCKQTLDQANVEGLNRSISKLEGLYFSDKEEAHLEGHHHHHGDHDHHAEGKEKGHKH